MPFEPLVPLAPFFPAEPVVLHLIFFSVFLHFVFEETMRIVPSTRCCSLDSIVRPRVRRLQGQGVQSDTGLRVTDLLCKVETEEQVLEYCAAFTQLYREEAHYLERTAPWVERVGLAHIKTKVVDNAANRKALAERFLVSQKPAQVDPWKARAEGEASHEFTPLAEIV